MADKTVTQYPKKCCGNCNSYNSFGDFTCHNRESDYNDTVQCPFEDKERCNAFRLRASWHILSTIGECLK